MDAANNHLATGDKWHPYNDPRRWADPGIWKRPFFNVDKHQKKINRIVGTADGKPIVRVVWAWDVKRWQAGEMRQAYKFYSAKLPNGDTCDLSPPRWMYEERIEPGQYMPNWNEVRYIRRQVDVRQVGTQLRYFDDYGNPLEKPVEGPVYEPVYELIDSLGDPPRDGFYSYFLTIADHDPDQTCCRRAWKTWQLGQRATMRCWGYYRKPGEKDLQILRDAKAARDATPYKQSPHEPLSAETLAEIAIMERSWNEAQHQNRKDRASELWRDHTRIWGWRIFEEDPAVLHHGIYKFMPTKEFAETESGLIVPAD